MTTPNINALEERLKEIANESVRYEGINNFDDMSKEMANIRGYDDGRKRLAKWLLDEFFGE